MCYGGDGPDFPPTIENRRAGKAHSCGECSTPILVGELYEHVRGSWEGDWETHRTCMRCVEARRWLEVVCRSWQYGAVLDDLRDHWDEGYKGLARLVVWAGYGRRTARTWSYRTPAEVAALVARSLERTPAEHKGAA